MYCHSSCHKYMTHIGGGILVTRVIRRVSLVEQEMLILPEHLSSSPVSSGAHIVPSFVFCVVFCKLLFVLLSSFLVIVLSVLRFTTSYYPLMVSTNISYYQWMHVSIGYFHHPGGGLTIKLSCSRLLYTNTVINVLDIK